MVTKTRLQADRGWAICTRKQWRHQGCWWSQGSQTRRCSLGWFLQPEQFDASTPFLSARSSPSTGTPRFLFPCMSSCGIEPSFLQVQAKPGSGAAPLPRQSSHCRLRFNWLDNQMRTKYNLFHKKCLKMKVAVKVSPRDYQRSGLREIQLENPLLGSMILHFLAIGYDFFFLLFILWCDVLFPYFVLLLFDYC